MLGFLQPERGWKTTAMRAVFGLASRWMVARCCGVGGRCGCRSGCGSATCQRSAACTRGCPCGSSSSTSASCTGWTNAACGCTRWLERLGLAERGEAKWRNSRGNQQRAQLAAALVHEPELLVLDEPFAGLDPLAVRTLAEVLRGEAARGAAVVFSSHQLELVEDICEDVVIIDHGRIVATGTVDALRRGSRRRRIELELEDASAWLPTIAGVELLEHRNGALRLLADCDVDPEQVLAERSVSLGSSPSATAHPRSRSSSWS